MRIDPKLLAFLTGFGFVELVYWLSGADIFTRSATTAEVFAIGVFVGLSVAFMVGMVEGEM